MMSLRPSKSGLSTWTLRSNRPGRSSAWSSTEAMLVAPTVSTGGGMARPFLRPIARIIRAKRPLSKLGGSICSSNSLSSPNPPPPIMPPIMPIPMPPPILLVRELPMAFDLVDKEDAAAVPPSQLAGLAVQEADPHRSNTEEHGLQARGRKVSERQTGLAGHHLRQVALAGTGRALQQQTADGLTAHALELAHTAQQRDGPPRNLQDLIVAAIVREVHAGLARLQPIGSAAAEEPENCDELKDHHRHQEEAIYDVAEDRHRGFLGLR